MTGSKGHRWRQGAGAAGCRAATLAVALAPGVAAAQSLGMPQPEEVAPPPSGLRLHLRSGGFIAGGYNHQHYERYDVNVGYFAVGAGGEVALRTSEAFAFGARLDAWGLFGVRESNLRTPAESRGTVGYGGYVGLSLSFFLAPDGYSVLDVGAGFMGVGRGGDFGGIGPGFNVGFARYFGALGRSALRQGIEVRAVVNAPQLSPNPESLRLFAFSAMLAVGYTFATF